MLTAAHQQTETNVAEKYEIWREKNVDQQRRRKLYKTRLAASNHIGTSVKKWKQRKKNPFAIYRRVNC